MLKKLFLTMSLLGLFTVCYGQGTTNPLPAMPQGKLLRVEYAYNGMRIPEYSDFDLKPERVSLISAITTPRFHMTVPPIRSSPKPVVSLRKSVCMNMETATICQPSWKQACSTVSVGISTLTLKTEFTFRHTVVTFCQKAKVFTL